MFAVRADDPVCATKFNELTRAANLATPSHGGLSFVGHDPVVGSRFRVGTASAAALAAHAAGVAALWELRTGRSQQISVDLRRAAAPGLRTSSQIEHQGQRLELLIRSNFAGESLPKTCDGRAFWFVHHPMYLEQFLASLDVLGCRANRTEISAAVAQRDADELEDALNARGLPGIYARSRAEWADHPQGMLVVSRPVIEIEKISDAKPKALTPAPRPMAGIRVLDLTHILAGPITSRTLAEHGGDVLRVASPWRPEPLHIVLDTGHGKRAANVDLSQPAGAERVRALADEADVIVSSFRVGALEKYGLSPEQIVARNPSAICVSITAYGADGPWRSRAGYDPVGQLACGLAVEEGGAGAPRLGPTGTLNDYLTAYLAAAGVMTALVRRAREGGGYHVKVSLTQGSMWLQQVGETSKQSRLPEGFCPDADASDFIDTHGPFGAVRSPGPIAQFSETSARWDAPPAPFGAHQPIWLDRAIA